MAAQETPQEVSLPVVPLERLLQLRETVKIWQPRVPLYTRDERFPSVDYRADGEVEYRLLDVMLFPTDVTIVIAGAGAEPIALLSRSPHGGCPIRWDEERAEFFEGCYGSRWSATGEYLFGPALQDLDRVPVQVRDGMIWVTNRIVRGAARASQ